MGKSANRLINIGAKNFMIQIDTIAVFCNFLSIFKIFNIALKLKVKDF